MYKSKLRCVVVMELWEVFDKALNEIRERVVRKRERERERERGERGGGDLKRRRERERKNVRERRKSDRE